MTNKVQWTVATGNSGEITVVAATIMNLDSLDTNRVFIKNPPGGGVTIFSFGPVQVNNPSQTVTKRIRYDNGVTIAHNPPYISLIGKTSVTTSTYPPNETNPGDIQFITGGPNGWTEEIFGTKPDYDLAGMAAAVKDLQTEVQNLQAEIDGISGGQAGLLDRVTALENLMTIYGMSTSGDLTVPGSTVMMAALPNITSAPPLTATGNILNDTVTGQLYYGIPTPPP